MAARANYLGQDRPDIQFAVKEICRGMLNPSKADLRKLRRLGRYLVGTPRVSATFKFQRRCREVWGYSDSDWAGCRVTGKSTSGGVIMIGSHFIKGWPQTQNHVTLSSAEAELIAFVKCTQGCLGVQAMMRHGEWAAEASACAYASLDEIDTQRLKSMCTSWPDLSEDDS